LKNYCLHICGRFSFDKILIFASQVFKPSKFFVTSEWQRGCGAGKGLLMGFFLFNPSR